MSDVALVIVDGPGRVGSEVGDALGIPYASLDATGLDAVEPNVDGADRLVWIHAVPAADGAGEGVDLHGVFAEAAALLGSARAARSLAAGCDASLTFIALVPSQGLLRGPHGAACDMAVAAMESLMRVEIGPWSNAGHRLVAIAYAGLDGPSLEAARTDDEIRKRTPTHELCTPGQLADAVRYAGSERAAYVTGTTLHVDGGWNAYSWMYPARTI